ncbi:DUF4479 domain-containing protein [Metabacillus sp. GX 13764]|uniref:YtpR family tRNA-binding protein n=1 Tax=Metabacillus kandeliae TaxID=2900151 RepID=UPI001E5C1B85|nr:DUF4479 family protein [Metabacillus kandeliae]MCD7032721.1 DUF4479 domain-containing protein [Metabacillus kandeliae]
MNAFYNKEGIGDTLLLFIKDIPEDRRTFDKKGDAVKIYDAETKETAGYNLFNASKYVQTGAKGQVELTEDFIAKVNAAFKENGLDEEVTADLSPKFVVGYVQTKEKHPNADKLNVCQVDVGEGVLQIVCGAPNVEAGQKVVVAKIGAVMPSGLIIKPAELRGAASSGMICSAKELDLPDAPAEKGILVLEDSWETGSSFF